MSKVTTLMQKIIAHEMRRIERLGFEEVSHMPNYSDRKRGLFIVAYWHERCEPNVSRLIVQVCFQRCLGAADVCADGMQFSTNGKRLLSMEEMTAFY